MTHIHLQSYKYSKTALWSPKLGTTTKPSVLKTISCAEALLVEAIQRQAPLPIINVRTIDPAVHGQHLDVPRRDTLTRPCFGACLPGCAGSQLKGWQPQHCIIGDLVCLLCKQSTSFSVCCAACEDTAGLLRWECCCNATSQKNPPIHIADQQPA